ncbi:MAG: type IX secretion system membrane protein PorP/SprF [Flavobacteriales bacterium]|nr:type IX secretion system membrane protein PorP/SprF [Flavobacteriales bacterium]
MKKIVYITFLVLVSKVVTGQQLPHFSQYYLNDYLINPAISGARPYFEAKSAHRYQWEGITDAPRTYTLSINGPTRNQKMGLGGYLFTDNVGPTRRTGVNLTYAYHIKVSEKLKLGMGLSAGIIQFMIDGSKITLRESDDDIITNGVQSVLLPDAGFGLYLYHEKYHIGFSAPQLLNSRVNFFNSGRNPEGTLPSHFFFSGGYKFKLSDEFVLEPTVFAKYISPVPLQIEGTLRVIYQEKIWLAGTYRDKDAITASIGYLINNYFTISYAFDFTTTNLRNYSDGTHELLVGVRFHAIGNKQSVPSIK